jgi:ElaB/YqjD/DUF883 family membrane-anchored ribosome-binding protein
MSDETEMRPVETIASLVEAEVAQDTRGPPGLSEILTDARHDVEVYVRANPWTGLFAAGVIGAILALIATG